MPGAPHLHCWRRISPDRPFVLKDLDRPHLDSVDSTNNPYWAVTYLFSYATGYLKNKSLVY